MSDLDLAYCLILGSGILHAIVNAVLKAGADKMVGRALIDGSGALFMLPVIFIVPLPTGAWHWLALSAAVHLLYLYSLVKAFELADFSSAYPIARGVAPALAAAVAVGVLGEAAKPLELAGIAAISAGVLAMAVGRHISRAALGWSLLTGLMIAAYTVVDANGVRAAPSALSYIAWVFVLLGALIAAFFAILSRDVLRDAVRTQWRPGLIAGFLSIGSYGLALSAYRLGPTAPVAALRETSIIAATVIAILFLNERVSWIRAVATLIIASGAALIIVA